MRDRSTRKTHTWRGKLLALLLTFSVVPLLLLAAWNFFSLRHAFEASKLQGLQAVVRSRAEAIDRFVEDRRSEVERIASLLVPAVVGVEIGRERPGDEPAGALPELQDADALATRREDRAGAEPISAAETDPPPVVSEALAELRQNLGLVLWDQRRFEELMVIDTQGRVIASTHRAHESSSAANREYFRQGLGVTHVEPVFLSPLTERLTMIVSTPIRDPGRGVVGVLAARLNLERFFRLINDVTGLGATGDTLAARRANEEVLLMAPTRTDPEAALQRRLPMGGPRAMGLQEAVRGRSGAGKIVDYRGERVLAAWEHVPSLDWGLVVKQDRAEVLRPVREAALQMLLLLLLVVGAVVAASLVASRALVRPLRELKLAADRISRGDLDVEISIDSDDEIGELADSFQRMVAAIKFFRRHSRPAEEDELLDEDSQL
jgi:HAMP domain-containing protein